MPIAAQNGNLNQLTSIASPGMYSANPYGGVSIFNNINPADIESIEVLRDADASAIYGSRGARRRGPDHDQKRGRWQEKYSSTGTYGPVKARLRGPCILQMNIQQYLAMRRQAIQNDGATPQIDQPYSAGYAPDILSLLILR